MKPRLTFVLFFLPCILVQAQLTIGIKSGLNLSDIVINNVNDPDGESDFNFKPGLHVGGFANADLGRGGLAAEVHYSVKGVRAVTTNINLHYITFPLLLRYSLSDRFIAEIGPEVGYLFAARSRHGNMNNIYDNRFDLGLDLGMQYIATSDILIGLRFNAGMLSVIKNPLALGQPENVSYQNRVVQISVGYILFRRKL